jgi:hypothetical protein
LARAPVRGGHLDRLGEIFTPDAVYDMSIFFEHEGDAPCRDSERHRRCAGRWVGIVSRGFGPDGKRLRRKVTGSTKSTVQDRLKRLHDELESGVRTTPNYTLRGAAEDWLREGLVGRSPKTVKKNENVLTPIPATIGGRKLRELTAGMCSTRWPSWRRSTPAPPSPWGTTR